MPLPEYVKQIFSYFQTTTEIKLNRMEQRIEQHKRLYELLSRSNLLGVKLPILSHLL